MRRCDWEGREDGGAGAALFAAAAAVAVEGGGGAEGDGVGGRMSAEDVPRDERLQYRCVRRVGLAGLYGAGKGRGAGGKKKCAVEEGFCSIFVS